MRVKRASLVGILGIVFLAGILRPAVSGVFDPETFILENGLQVVVISDHRAPVVNHMIWYKVGAADEAPGKSGIAHFLEHLMFKGTAKVAPAEFSKIVARNGGQDNAFTSQDYTAYFQNVAVDKLDLVMGLEADRMVNLKLDEASVRTERDVVLEERRDFKPVACQGTHIVPRHPFQFKGELCIPWCNRIRADKASGHEKASSQSKFLENASSVFVIVEVTIVKRNHHATTYIGFLPQSLKQIGQRYDVKV